MTLDEFRAACQKLRLTYGYEPKSSTWYAQKRADRHPIRYSLRDIRRLTLDELKRDFDAGEVTL